MRMRCRLGRLALVAVAPFLFLLIGSAAGQNGSVDLKAVKYKELGQAVRALKGNIVVVDFWATT